MMVFVRQSLPLLLGVAFVAATFADEAPRLIGKQIAPTASAVNASLPASDGEFKTTAIASFDPNAKNFLRLESAWTRNLDEAGQWLRVGDSVSNPGSWGSAVRFAGVQFGTVHTRRSDLIDLDRFAIAGVSVLPSAADAMLAGAGGTPMTQRGVSVNGPAAVTGINTLAFNARDASGRETNITRPLFAKPAAAEVGCKQFTLGVGRARKDYALVSNNYGALFANSTVVCGTDSGYTIEAHGEYLEGDASLAGLDVMRSVGALGTASLALAASQKDEDSGWLLRAGLQRSTGRFEVNLRARLQSPDFRELGMTSTQDTITSRMLASVGAKLSDGHMLALAYANQTTASLQRVDVVAMMQTIELGNNGSRGKIAIVADRAVQDDNNTSVRVSFVRPLRD